MAITEAEQRILDDLSVLSPAEFGDFPNTSLDVAGELGPEARAVLDRMAGSAQLAREAFSWVSDPLHPVDQISLLDMGLGGNVGRETPHTLSSGGTTTRYVSGTWTRQWGSPDAPHRIIAFAPAGGGDQPDSDDALAITTQYLEYANRTGPNSGVSGNVSGIGGGAPSCGITLVPVPPEQLANPEPFMHRMVKAIRGERGSPCTDYAVVAPDQYLVAHGMEVLGNPGLDRDGKNRSYGQLDFEAEPWQSEALFDLVAAARKKKVKTSGVSQTTRHVEWQVLPKQLQGSWPPDAQWSPEWLRGGKAASQGFRLGPLMRRKLLQTPHGLTDPRASATSFRPGRQGMGGPGGP